MQQVWQSQKSLLLTPVAGSTAAEQQQPAAALPHAAMQATLREYEGDRDPAGLCHGQGRAVFNSGSVYSGEWRLGHMDGSGDMQFPDGICYSGTFASDSISGSGVSDAVHCCQQQVVYPPRHTHRQSPSPSLCADVHLARRHVL